MLLIVNEKTGRIINDYLLKVGDLKSEQLFDTWRQSDGVVVYPPDCSLILKMDDEYDFQNDKKTLGYTNTYYYIDEQIVLKQIVEPESVRYQITQLEEELRKNDYKVIKSFEAQLVGAPCPYDINKVHIERQATRDKINELESFLTTE